MNPLVRTRIDVLGGADIRGNGVKSGIEALDVAHLKDDVLPLRDRHQLIGFRSGDANRLLDQQGDAGCEEVASDAVVQGGGRGDHGAVEAIEQAGVIGQGLGMALGGDAIAAGGDGIDDGQEVNVVSGGEFLGVEAAEPACADDGDAEFVHGKWR